MIIEVDKMALLINLNKQCNIKFQTINSEILGISFEQNKVRNF